MAFSHWPIGSHEFIASVFGIHTLSLFSLWSMKSSLLTHADSVVGQAARRVIRPNRGSRVGVLNSMYGEAPSPT
jgi:hypothetical protein